MQSEIEAAVLDGAGKAYRPRRGETRAPGSPCANCGATLAGPWCHACGQLAEDFHRSARRLVMELVEGLTHLDGRFWRTAPNLALKPARLTLDYIDGHRASQIPPLRLFLVVLLLFFLAASVQDVKLGYVSATNHKVVTIDTPQSRAESLAAIDRSDFKINLGDARRSAATADWLKSHLKAVLSDPERFKLILDSQEERFAFLALPVATGLLALLFIFQRRFYVFDHTIFALHSLSFQGLLLSASSLAGLVVGDASGFLLLIAPVHLYAHMRGVYRMSLAGTLLRMALLALGSFVAFVVLFLALLLFGLNAMGAS